MNHVLRPFLKSSPVLQQPFHQVYNWMRRPAVDHDDVACEMKERMVQVYPPLLGLAMVNEVEQKLVSVFQAAISLVCQLEIVVQTGC
jgi:hypothetical protein